MQIQSIEPNNKITEILYKDFSSILQPAHILVGEEKISLPVKYKDVAEQIENFEVFDDDIFLLSYPKTGTTWTQEIIWYLVHEVDKEENSANKETIPFLEIVCIYDYSIVLKNNPNFIPPYHISNSIDVAKNHPLRPRIIKSHLPWSLLPKQIREKTKKPKIIYVTRNVKDTCVSYYHHEKLLSGHTGNLEDFCMLFQEGLAKFGNYISHIKSVWPHKNDPNFLLITYEQLKADLPSTIEKISMFLDKPLSRNNPRMKIIIDGTSFENMKKNIKSANRGHFLIHKEIYNNDAKGQFIRKGIVGGYKEEMNEEMIKKFDEWIKDNTKGCEDLRSIVY